VIRKKGAADPKAQAGGAAPVSKPKKRRDASLIVVYGIELGRRIPLEQTLFTIGRSSRCDLFIDQDAVSRKHAEIAHTKGRYVIYDQRSRNGTHVNDERVTERVLADGDKIQIGQTLFTFLSGDDLETRFQDQIYRVMTVDGLTGAYNRRYWTDALERECARALRYERPLSIVLFDIDGFDQPPRKHGPLGDDALLRGIVMAVRPKLRQQDILGRIGTGSFGVLLPEIEAEGATTAAEKVRSIAESTKVLCDWVPLTCTLSVGVATLSRSEATPLALLFLAQTALSQARGAGGNQIRVAKDSSCPP
jgi:two-component system cell cycle response regulator